MIRGANEKADLFVLEKLQICILNYSMLPSALAGKLSLFCMQLCSLEDKSEAAAAAA